MLGLVDSTIHCVENRMRLFRRSRSRTNILSLPKRIRWTLLRWIGFVRSCWLYSIPVSFFRVLGAMLVPAVDDVHFAYHHSGIPASDLAVLRLQFALLSDSLRIPGIDRSLFLPIQLGESQSIDLLNWRCVCSGLFLLLLSIFSLKGREASESKRIDNWNRHHVCLDIHPTPIRRFFTSSCQCSFLMPRRMKCWSIWSTRDLPRNSPVTRLLWSSLAPPSLALWWDYSLSSTRQ